MHVHELVPFSTSADDAIVAAKGKALRSGRGCVAMAGPFGPWTAADAAGFDRPARA